MTTPEPLSARYRLDVVHAGEHTFDMAPRIRAVAAAQLFTEISTASGRRARSV